MKDETEEEQYEEGVVVKTLGEVCSILTRKVKESKSGINEGVYPFIGSSKMGYL